MPVAHKVVNKRLANLIAEHGATIIKTATVTGCVRVLSWIGAEHSGWATALPSPTLYKIYLRWQYRLVEGCPYW